ncbi:hypothetical protein EDD16DRAFT_1693798 [Pisolithus croceorrhizus]|nr:hypothetical protein EDD16DRAFT_1693798 [Pisolithus croceorrhizus]KAI6169308.1 hypothetical protein EDD17DRAFT_1772194 [Pisolithus thermaeus]
MIPRKTNLLEALQRDPHQPPALDSESFTNPTSATLYLPPLLSSLPPGVEVPVIQSDRPPLVTKTRLPDIDPVSLSLHKALHYFRPLSSEYASLPYAGAFNWLALDLPLEEEREWYAVAFRSKRKAGSDSDALYEADRLAHEEAVSNGGLIMYWYGVPDPQTGLNLATCIWQSRTCSCCNFTTTPHSSDEPRRFKGKQGIQVEEFSVGVEAGW